MQSSLKEKKLTELKVLRFVLSQLKYEEINKQKELSDGDAVIILQKEVKKRREAIEMFKKGGREDLVNDEEAQIQVIQKYLPKEASDTDIAKIIDSVLSGLSQPYEMGQVMKAVMPLLKGKADGTKVSAMVKERMNESK